MGDELLTVAEVARELRVSEATVRGWIRKRKLRAIRPGDRAYRVRRSELERRTAALEPESGNASAHAAGGEGPPAGRVRDERDLALVARAVRPDGR